MKKIKLLILITCAFFILISFVYSQPSVKVESDKLWEQASSIIERIISPVFPEKDFEITEYGAVGDGKTNCTESFRKAIAECHKEGGGRVVVPEGVFLTGPIHLKSHVNLHVKEKGVILFTRDPEHYLPVVFTRWEGVECLNYSPFIYGYELENIAITGSGTIDGNSNCDHWWPWKGRTSCGWKRGDPRQHESREKLFEMGQKGIAVDKRVFGNGHYLRPQFIQPYRCKNVLIEGVTLKNSPMWEIHPVLCENVTVRNVTIISHGPNNDGCDPESCKDVLIENCFFDTGDDCIALKSGRNNDGRRIGMPCENVIIRNCQMKDGHGGVVIGSEISGGCRNIFVENCQMDSPSLDRALRIKTNSLRGGPIEHIYLRHITVGQVREAVIKINFLYEEGDAGNHLPIVRNIRIQNLTCNKSRYGLYMRGYERSPVRDIWLDHCTLNHVAKGNILEHVKDLNVEDVWLNGEIMRLKNK